MPFPIGFISYAIILLIFETIELFSITRMPIQNSGTSIELKNLIKSYYLLITQRIYLFYFFKFSYALLDVIFIYN